VAYFVDLPESHLDYLRNQLKLSDGEIADFRQSLLHLLEIARMPTATSIA